MAAAFGFVLRGRGGGRAGSGAGQGALFTEVAEPDKA
jgi:aquaporin Z